MNIKSMAAIGALGVGALVFTASNGATAAASPAPAFTCDGQQDCDYSNYMAERTAELKAQLQALKANALAMKDGEAQTLREEAQTLREQLMAENGAALQELKELRQGVGMGQGSGWGQSTQIRTDDGPQTFWVDSDEPQGEEPGWLGVQTEGINSDRAKDLKLAEVRGVYLSEVEEDSPAAKAGLKKGDVVLEFNGEHVEGTVQFRRLIREIPAGHTVQISVWRDGRSQSMSITLGSAADSGDWNVMNTMPAVAPMPPAAPRARAFSFSMPNFELYAGAPAPTIGISAEDLSGQLGDYFGAPDGEGVLITEVESGTPAEKAGLKAGDVVIKVAGERVRNLGEMRDRLRDKRDDKTVQLTVLRKGSEQTLTVEPLKPHTQSLMGRRATF
jgi:serine protease Do